MPKLPVEDLATHLDVMFGTWWQRQRHLPSTADELAQLMEGIMQWTAATVTHLCGVVTQEHRAAQVALLRASLARYQTMVETRIASLTPGDPDAPSS
jgi:hypothetical protein